MLPNNDIISAAPTHQRLSLSNGEEAMSGNVVGPYTAGSQVGQLILYPINIYD